MGQDQSKNVQPGYSQAGRERTPSDEQARQSSGTPPPPTPSRRMATASNETASQHLQLPTPQTPQKQKPLPPVDQTPTGFKRWMELESAGERKRIDRTADAQDLYKVNVGTQTASDPTFEDIILDTLHNNIGIIKILEEEDQKYKGTELSPLLQKIDETEFREHNEITASMILHYMGPDLVQALVEGDLAYKFKGLGKTELLPDQATRDNEERPSIYGHFWVNEATGRPPTANQMLYIIGKARLYYARDSDESDVLAQKVDNYNKSRSVAKDSKRRTFFISDHQVEEAYKWFDRMEKYIQDNIPPDQRDKPMPRSTAEIGWAAVPAKRGKQHASYTTGSSVALMNLMDVLGRLHLGFYSAIDAPGPRANYVMKFYIICDLTDISQPTYAEHIISMLSGSYAFRSPFGFNTIPAGKSIESAKDISEVIWDKQLRRIDPDRIVKRIEAQHQRARQDKAKQDQYNESRNLDRDLVTGEEQVEKLKEHIKKLKLEDDALEKEIQETIKERREVDKDLEDELQVATQDIKELKKRVDALKRQENAKMAYMRDRIERTGPPALRESIIASLKGRWFEDYILDEEDEEEEEAEGE